VYITLTQRRYVHYKNTHGIKLHTGIQTQVHVHNGTSMHRTMHTQSTGASEVLLGGQGEADSWKKCLCTPPLCAIMYRPATWASRFWCTWRRCAGAPSPKLAYLRFYTANSCAVFAMESLPQAPLQAELTADRSLAGKLLVQPIYEGGFAVFSSWLGFIKCQMEILRLSIL